MNKFFFFQNFLFFRTGALYLFLWLKSKSKHVFVVIEAYIHVVGCSNMLIFVQICRLLDIHAEFMSIYAVFLNIHAEFMNIYAVFFLYIYVKFWL